MLKESSLDHIPGGYILLSRKLRGSQVMNSAPVVREMFIYFLLEANHADNQSLGIKRGQCVRRISDIQEALHWNVGYRKKTYSKSQCEGALEALRKMLMIETTKTTRGMIVTVCNYGRYQSPENYEGNNEDGSKILRRQQQADTINKNDKEEKNVKDISKEKKFSKPELSDVIAYFLNHEKPQSQAEMFYDYYESKGWKVGKAPMKNWESACRNWFRNIKNYGNTKNNSIPAKSSGAAKLIDSLRDSLGEQVA